MLVVFFVVVAHQLLHLLIVSATCFEKVVISGCLDVILFSVYFFTFRPELFLSKFSLFFFFHFQNLSQRLRFEFVLFKS